VAISHQAIAAPGALADLVAAYIDISADARQELLETVDLVARIDKVTKFLSERLLVLRLSNEIGQQTKAAFDKLSYSHRKEYVDWINDAKKAETLERRLKKLVSVLVAKVPKTR